MVAVPDFRSKLLLPLIAAPMSGVSTPELVTEACLAGIAGSFPDEELPDPGRTRFMAIEHPVSAPAADSEGNQSGLLSANLVIRGNNRLAEDIKAIIHHGVDFVITSVGSPKEFVAPFHDAGIAVLRRRCLNASCPPRLEAGVDGLVLLSAGAGGHTGWANGFAFARAVRARIFAARSVPRQRISDGAALWASRSSDTTSPTWAPSSSPRTRAWPPTEPGGIARELSLDEIELVRGAERCRRQRHPGWRRQHRALDLRRYEYLSVRDLVTKPRRIPGRPRGNRTGAR